MTYAIDISVHTGEVTAAQWACLKRVGVQKVIVGMQHHALAVRQIKGALAAGLNIEAYVYLYFRGDVATRVRSACEALKGVPVQRLWLDCEDTTSGLPPNRIIQKITEADLATHFRTGIYTRHFWWKDYTGDTQRFGALPLWDADYDGLVNLHAFTPYGGWTQRAVKQYAKDTEVCGIWCCKDWYEEAPTGLSPKWDETQLARVWRATSSGRVEAEELPQQAGKHRWLVEIPRNTP